MTYPIKRRLLVGLILLAIIGMVAGLWPYARALFPEERTREAVSDLLSPWYEIYRPEGDGPFPTVLLFHGCGGPQPEISRPRGEWLRDNGYVAILVDSFSGRKLTARPVCKGHALWGNERVVDVRAALSHVRQLPYVASDRLALLGYSHGGWTVLDALAYGPDPVHGSNDEDGQALDGVRAVAAYYPYCGFPARFRSEWAVKQPTLVFLAGQDTVIDTAECVDVFDRYQANDYPVETRFFPGVEHVFDAPSAMNSYDLAAAKAAEIRLLKFLEDNLLK